MLSIRTAVFGLARRIRRAASIPFIPGMATSIMTTSGECSAVICTHSRPSPASATTDMSGCRSSSARRPSRTMVWSSASKMRIGMDLDGPEIGERKLGPNGRPQAELRVNRQFAAQTAYALLHAEQTEAAHRFLIEADAVVLDGEQHTIAGILHGNIQGPGAGVARGVVERLLHKPINAGFVLVGQIVAVFAGIDPDVESGPLAHFASMPVERGHEAEIVQHGRTQK